MEWKKLATVDGDLEAEVVCGLLEGEGIPARKKYRGIDQYLKIVMGPVVAVEIWVPEEKFAEAGAILKSFEAREAEED